MNNNFIFELYKKPQTVFTLKELSMMFANISYNNLKRKADYFASVGKLKRLRRGVYAKDSYNLFELASKIYTPSYISLETILLKEGLIFQNSQVIFLVSYLTRKIKVGKQEIYYRKIKDEVLFSDCGLEKKERYFLATVERAFLDAVFIYKDYHFDNLSPLDWEKVNKLVKIYQSKILEKRINWYYKNYAISLKDKNQKMI